MHAACWILLAGCVGSVGSAAWAAPGTPVATVGPLVVTQGELDKRSADMQRAYESRRGQTLSDVMRLAVRRQALETLVRGRLFRLEAARREVPVSQSEAEDILKKLPIFNPGGRFSSSAYQNAQLRDPKKFAATINEIKADLRSDRLSEDLRRRNTPGEDKLRQAARRSLESADIRWLAIPYAPFSGTRREPAEREVLDYYRRHAAEFVRAGDAQVHVVELAPGPRGEERARVRARADSALDAVRAGMSLDEASERFNGTVRQFQLRDDNFPGSWKGTAAQNTRVFQSETGIIFPELVASERGWLVVQIDRATPRHGSALRDVGLEIRDTLRTHAAREEDERELAAMYAAAVDSMSRPGYRIRYAVVDPAAIKVGAPTSDDLTRYYELHRADYTRYDAATHGIVVTPLVQVRDEIAEKWARSELNVRARDLAGRLRAAWSQNRRDRGLESQVTVNDLGAVPFGSGLGADRAAAAIADTLRRRVYDRRVEIVPYPGGIAVVHVYELVERVTPSLGQVREALSDRLERDREASDIARARAIFDRDPLRFQQDKLVHYSRMWVRLTPALEVPLSKAEVEDRYRTHLSEYAQPERYRVRQILARPARPDSQSMRAAAERARALVRRIRAGEDFAEVARKESDDDLTREDGGDLGYRAPGELDPLLQNAAFALKAGEVSNVVEMADGCHVLQVTEYVPGQAEPLAWVYTTVAYDAALEKSQRMARHVADSLAQVIRSPEQARVVARQLGLQVRQYRHKPGDRAYSAEQLHMALLLETLKPGTMYPGSETFRGQGSAVMWVDSVAAPRLMRWDEAQRVVLDEYRRDAKAHSVQRKLAELDSLMRAGTPFDTLAAAWGGAKRDSNYVRGKGLPLYFGASEIDSVVYGASGAPPLPVGQLSGWIALQQAQVRLRVANRKEPSGSDVEFTMGQIRGIALEYGLQNEVKDMKKRFPVKIVDPMLRDVPLPPLPPLPEL